MPATNPLELKVKRRLLQKYLEDEHEMIVLKRQTIVDTPARGKKRGPVVDLPEQMFRLYPQVRRMSEETRDTPDGDIANVHWIMIGLWDADVKKADRFVWNGGKYDVKSVNPKREDRTAAMVIYRGEADDEPW